MINRRGFLSKFGTALTAGMVAGSAVVDNQNEFTIAESTPEEIITKTPEGDIIIRVPQGRSLRIKDELNENHDYLHVKTPTLEQEIEREEKREKAQKDKVWFLENTRPNLTINGDTL